MTVIVTVQGGAAQVAYRPDDVPVRIVDLDNLRLRATTDRSMRAFGRLAERLDSLETVGLVDDADFERIQELVERVRGAAS